MRDNCPLSSASFNLPCSRRPESGTLTQNVRYLRPLRISPSDCEECWYRGGVIADLISKGVEKIANRKKLTSEDLTVLLLHEQSKSIARLELGMNSIAAELREFRKEMLPLLTQTKDIAEIKAQLSELRARIR